MKAKIQYANLDDLMLDPLNPRLGRGNTGEDVKQSTIQKLMRDWTLDELAVSFLENGFWPQEALIVVRESLYNKPNTMVVVEGNRRLAALKLLKSAAAGDATDRRMQEIVADLRPAESLFSSVPYIEVDSREEVEAFLGFRHVTGIKEWKPAEKAEYIVKLIETRAMSYQQVMRKIGSKTPTVRQNYISYRLLLQMEDSDNVSVDQVEERFSVLFLSLRTEGVRKYLSIDIQAEPSRALKPVPPSHLKQLANFSMWLFGSEDREPVVRDSRQVDQFGAILLSRKAVEYLERTAKPKFEFAYQLAGGDEPEIVRLIDAAADNIEIALGRAHHYKKSRKVHLAMRRLGNDSFRLLSLVPGLWDEINKENKEADA